MSERVKFLLVDDSEENLVALSALLVREGLELLCASSGVEALELLLRHEFALAIVDVQMPEMDGFELAELMRGSERSKHVPIIFATASAHQQQRVFKGYESGAVDFLFKPIDPHILRQKAAVFFELALQRDQLSRQIKEREALLADVRETLRLNETFTAALGHDLRTPLNAIVAGAAILSEGVDDEKHARVAERILGSAQRMARMIEELLDVARTRLSDGISLVPVVMDLGLLCERIVAEAQCSAPTREIELEASGALDGSWDEVRIGQVLANLLHNAVRHGSPGTGVRVRVDGRNASAVRLEVHNQGNIPAADVPFLFDPFRSATKRTRSQEGLGLGLYIVHQIVLAHGGEVTVQSSERDGTTFCVILPRFGALPTTGREQRADPAP